jgi:PLP dependent protein
VNAEHGLGAGGAADRPEPSHDTSSDPGARARRAEPGGPDAARRAEPAAPDAARREEIAANLAEVRERIAAACRKAGRQPDSVNLIAVSKTFPAQDVLHLVALGIADIGENRDQEAAGKAAQVRAAGATPHWHFIGQLQRNKCKSVAGYADLVHSVDRLRLVDALARAAEQVREQPLGVLVQCSLDGDVARGGAAVDSDEPEHDFFRVAEAVAGQPSLRLAGLMAVAPLTWPAGYAFARLAGVAQRLREAYPQATAVSAGMSGDLEEAIEHGATHVRIGAALLGSRPPLR